MACGTVLGLAVAVIGSEYGQHIVFLDLPHLCAFHRREDRACPKVGGKRNVVWHAQ